MVMCVHEAWQDGETRPSAMLGVRVLSRQLILFAQRYDGIALDEHRRVIVKDRRIVGIEALQYEAAGNQILGHSERSFHEDVMRDSKDSQEPKAFGSSLESHRI